MFSTCLLGTCFFRCVLLTLNLKRYSINLYYLFIDFVVLFVCSFVSYFVLFFFPQFIVKRYIIFHDNKIFILMNFFFSLLFPIVFIIQKRKKVSSPWIRILSGIEVLVYFNEYHFTCKLLNCNIILNILFVLRSININTFVILKKNYVRQSIILIIV